MLNLFTITPENTASIWTYAGEIITDISPILVIFMGVAVGLLVLVGVIKAVKS